MKQMTIIIMAILVLGGPAIAENLGVLSSADYVRVWCKAINSSGVEASADSGHVLVSFNREATANSASYTVSWTGAGASGTFIDSVRFNDHTYYYFIDQVADIDNDEGNGPYFGDVVLYTGGLPWHNKFAFVLAGDELSDYLASIAAVAADAANLDGWNPASDSVNVKGLNAARLGRLDSLDFEISSIVALLLDADTAGHNIAGSIGRLLRQLDTLNNLLAAEDLASQVADSVENSRQIGQRLDDALMWLRDSLPVYFTFAANGHVPWATHSKHADVDTLFLGAGVDTCCGAVYPHTGGSPGDPPTAPVTTFKW